MYYMVSCDSSTITEVGDSMCLDGPGPHIITFCKPGNNPNQYIISGIGSGKVSPPITVSNACTDTLTASGFNETSLSWTSFPYNATYNAYLSDTAGEDTVIAQPFGVFPDSVIYVVCGNIAGLACGGVPSQKCDTTTVYFVTNFNVAISPQNPTICFGGGPATLTANASGGAAPYTYLWSTGETTQSINVSSGNAGLYWVEVKDTLECAGVLDSVTVTEFTSSIAANAGNDLNSCANNPTVTLNGSIQAASGGIWNGGAGAFSPNDSTLNADYTPGAAEISAGFADLLLITTGNGTCPADTDSVVINISPSPVVDAGISQTVCSNAGIAVLSGNVSGGSTSGQWASSGSGTFSPDDSTLNAAYNLSAADISSGSVTLTLTSTNNGQCTSVSDSMLVNITPLIVVNAGTDQTVCANNSSTALSGSVTGPTTTGAWTTSGSGTFTPNDSDLAATYQPSAGDTAAGTVNIILTSTNNGSCNAISDTLALTITSIPQVNAGADLSACKNNPNTMLSGNVSGGTITGQWSTSGSGTFSPNDSDLAATYVPGPGDTTAGSITIVLTSTNNNGCNAVTDETEIVFTESPTANAGASQSVCADAPAVSLSGNVTIASGGVWTTNGTGIFSPGDSLLITSYFPSSSDTAAGTVEIILTTTGNGNCNAVSDTMLITITDAPSVEAGTNQTVCANNSTVSLNGSVSIATGGIWTTSGTGNFSPGDSLLNTSYLPSASDTAAGTVTIYLTTTGNGSCNAVSDSLQIAITPAPVADAGADISVCKTNPDAVLNGNVFVAAGGTWTTSGTGSFNPNANDLNATYIPGASDVSNGSVIITLTTTGNGLCNAVSDDVIITYTTDSVSVNAGNDTTVCSASFPLNGNVFIATGGVWTTNGSGTFSPDDTTLNAVYSFSNADTTAGSVTFVLTTTGNGGCASKNDTVVVSLAESISVNASAADSVCGNGDPVPINAISSTLEGIWTTTGDGTFSPSDTALSASYSPGTTDISNGNTTLFFATTNNNGCAPLTDTVVINLVPAPFTDFVADSVCLNNTTTFTDATTTVGTIVSWNWDFGDGNFSATQNTMHQFSSDGIHNVTLTTVSNYGCPDSITRQVVVFSLPVADFVSASQCFVDSVSFSDLSTINSGSIAQWQWDFGDGNNSSLQNPSHLYATPGVYNVSLITFSAFGCSDTISKSLNIQPAPIAGFSNTTGCHNAPVFFFDFTTISSGNIASWNWNFGDGTPASSVPDPSHIYSTAGTFSVELITVSDSGCSDTIVKQITVFPMPAADFSSTAQCFVDSVFFTDGSTIPGGNIISWNWNFGDGTPTSSVPNPSHFYSSAGIFNVSLIIVSDSGCADTVSKSVTVNPSPLADFGNSSGCLGVVTLFSDSSTVSSGNIVSWNWNFGDSSTGSGQNPTHLYSGEGTYTVQLIAVSDSGCTDTIVKQITVYPLPVAEFTSSAQCFVDSVFFTDASTISSGSIVQWLWNFGDGNNSGQQNSSHFYSSLGNYTVSLVVISEFGCSDTVSHTIAVAPAPIANFIMSTSTVCLNQPILFADISTISSGSIVAWSWDFGDGGTAGSSSVFHSYATSDTFTIALTVTSNLGCTDSFSLNVIAHPSPLADFEPVGFCINEGTRFLDSSAAYPDTVVSWQWYFGDGTTAFSQNPVHFYSLVGSYEVIMIATTNHGCKDTLKEVITVNPAPEADFTPDNYVVLTGDPINFNNASTGSSAWSWDFGDSAGTSAAQHPEYIYSGGGTFIITLIAENEFNCKDTSLDSVIVNVPPKVPNGFSPNGDGKNDLLFPMGGPYRQLEFKIFNNWGELIYISRNSAEGWDGTKNGIAQPIGVYVYMLYAVTEDGNEHNLHGDVTLLR